METQSRKALGALLACCAFSSAYAAPSFRILYHETIRPESHPVRGHGRSLSFEAYGQRFSVQLQDNPAMQRALPGRPDIEALSGQLEGQARSWARLTHTRTGWHGLISDGQELYALATIAEVSGSLVQPLGDVSSSTAVVYRLKDALVTTGAAYCEILNADGTPYVGGPSGPGTSQDLTGQSGNASGQDSGHSAVGQSAVTAQTLYNTVVREIAAGPGLQLTLGLVADYEFYKEYSDDPEGEIVSRINIVDGIWSSQAGVKMSLAPVTLLKSANEPFTKTDPTQLLSQVRKYRGSHSDQMATGVTHLMTGRDLDGQIVGIAYMNSVCNADSADSLSEGSHSTLMSALIMAHELGHNFNAPHDGQPGACSSTPQTYLMAPKINFSTEFSACSLKQIQARMQTARCLTPYVAPDVAVELPKPSVDATANTPFTLSFTVRAVGDGASTSVSAEADLPPDLTLKSATVEGGTCTVSAGTASCSLGDLTSQESRRIDLTVLGASVGTSTATVSVASTNDSVGSNDTADVPVQITAPAPSTAPASGGPDTGGGGGGGSLSFGTLVALAGLLAAAKRRREVRKGHSAP